ncbi:MAG: metallophosphoesterase family protein [archaeon]|nr:MAG: metallophosphoesterase family protein [archaeon]
MEELAFISDVHSNVEALEAVLEKAGGADVYCLGDLVGYGASPNEVVDLLRSRRARCLRGNHDEAALTGNVGGFNSRAAMAALWTRTKLTPASREFIAGLPSQVRSNLGGIDSYLAHGSPDDPLWEYVDPSTHSQVFEHYLRKLSVKIIGLGHSHLPYAWEGGGGLVFNPGSVGQPRDGDPRASYSVLSFEGGHYEVRNFRVEYDVNTSAEKIRKAGLADSLAARLYKGT